LLFIIVALKNEAIRLHFTWFLAIAVSTVEFDL